MLDGFENSVCLFVKVANCKTLRTEYTACGIVCLFSYHRFKLTLVSNECFGCRNIMRILKLSGFPLSSYVFLFCHCFQSYS